MNAKGGFERLRLAWWLRLSSVRQHCCEGVEGVHRVTSCRQTLIDANVLGILRLVNSCVHERRQDVIKGLLE